MNGIEQLKNLLKGGFSPKELTLKLLNNNGNPVLKNLIQMAEKGDYQGIENVARNIYKEQGKDFDKELSSLMSNFK